MGAETSGGALEGLRVLDLTRILAGPLCTQMLGDMGADVIKVEPPGAGDDTRTWGPPFIGGESAYFLGVNRNKRSLTLNMGVKAGQEILQQLLKKSDVVVENFKLGTLEKWGVTNEWLEQNAPRVIRCSITGYGSSGPDSALPGYDFILQAESGLMSICGEPGGTPTKYGVAIVDVVTGLYACNVIVSALAARNRTGRGQHVEVCLYDSGIAMLINVASSYLLSGRDARRYGNGHPSIVPYTTYPAADGLIAVAVGNDAQFARFAGTAGHPEWAQDERFAKNPARVTHREVLDGLIAQALKGGSTATWIGKLRAAGVPCGPINSVAGALDDPHTLARGMVRSVKHPTVGDLRMVGIPFRFSGTPAAIRLPPPLLGQHTEEVLGGELGIPAARIAQLRADKVI
ncbi:MAG: CoA-transferase [Betaproteobacteria bacterium RIFCSPLOWO2_02_FULL_67_26]|nr:MAG: CoA-transferase [Betaproteobacteria bacterium RIFCSPLOWO2_02_FULL_67_26]